MNEVVPRTSTIGAVTGVVLSLFGLLTSVWFPTLASVFAVGGVALGLTQHRHASGGRRSLARLAVVVGIGAALLTIAVVIVTTGSSAAT